MKIVSTCLQRVYGEENELASLASFIDILYVLINLNLIW